MESLQRLFDRRNGAAWVVLLICLSLTLTASDGLRRLAEKSAQQQFELYARDAVGSIEDRLRQREQILLGAAALFEATGSVDRAAWHDYIERLALKDNQPQMQGVGFSQVIKQADLPSHISAIRAEGFPAYTVYPPGKRPLYAPVVYLEPFSGSNLAAFGYDMMSDATRAKALNMAAESGKTALTGKVKLVPEAYGEEQVGILMYIPVYRRNQHLTTPGERWRALRGFVYSPFRADELVTGILGHRSDKIDLAIFDGDKEVDEARIFGSAVQPGGGRAASPKMSARRAINAYGHTWTVRLDSRPKFEAGFESPLNATVLAMGGGISVLVFLLVSFLILRREHAEELARRMTSDIRANEEKLRQSEARLAEGQRIAKLGSWELDIQAGKLIWSDEAFRVFEVDRSSFAATYQGFLDAVHPEDRDAVNNAYLDSLATRKPCEIIHRVRMSDGRIKWVQERCTSDFGADGKPVRSRGTVQDITERKIAEDELRETKHLLDSIIENIPAMVFLRRPDDLRFELFNRAGEKLLGYSRNDLVGKSVYDLFPKEQADLSAADDRKVIASDHVLEIPEEPIQTASGEMRYFQTWKVALRDEGGKASHLLGISIDITERKHAEAELRKLSEAIEQSPVSVVITDADANIEYANTKFSEITGYTFQEALGKNPRIIQSGLTPREVYRSMWKAIRSGGQWHGTLQNRKKNGELYWEDINISAIRNAEGRIINYVAVKEDITELMKIERMKNEFISTVSHELRTPLTSIRGALALIVGGVAGELPPAAKPLVEIAHKNSERLILLVNDILDMEKIEAGKMEFNPKPIDFMPLLKQAIDSNRSYAEQFNVTYELRSELSEVTVNVDSNRLMQVLANLLSNAAKFSPPGGKVTISTASDGKHVRVSVSNRGSGIPEQFRSQVFQKFAQADSSDTRTKGGSGLGLSITKAMVEKMGGTIGFDSQPDVLTTFFVEFPIWQEEVIGVPAPKGAKKHVLICEDDRDIAALLRMTLEQAGLSADIAYSARQAKQLLAQNGYAAMTLDLALPDQDGITFIRELRAAKQTATLPIVVVSANVVEGRKQLGDEAFSVIDWISKPIDQDQLVAVLRQTIRLAPEARPKVLHVEDDPDVFMVVNAIAGEFADLDNATSLAEARQMLELNHYDLAILDLLLPDGSGMKLLPMLNGASPPTPVLVFSVHEVEQEDKHKVESALVKSRTDNAQLLATIKRLIGVE